MFCEQHLAQIDPDYFDILHTDRHNVFICSKNTGHSWYLFSSEQPGKDAVWIFHRHHDIDLFHRHGRARTLPQAIRIIQRHDEFQMNGRIPVEHSVWDGIPLEGCN